MVMKNRFRQTKCYGEKHPRYSLVLFFLTLFIGITFLLYPTIGNIIVTIEQTKINNEYKEVSQNMSEEDIQKKLTQAQQFNENLENSLFFDAFDISQHAQDETTSNGYYNALDIDEDNVLGTIEIPKINVDLPIYYGSSEISLQKGIGHLEGSSLPIGGIGTHSVLTGHSGLPNSKLFTDLDQLVIGDNFYVYVFGEVLQYSVVEINTVLPNDYSKLNVKPNSDFLTLMTCTPYGFNTHRLLIKGERVLTEDTLEALNSSETNNSEDTNNASNDKAHNYDISTSITNEKNIFQHVLAVVLQDNAMKFSLLFAFCIIAVCIVFLVIKIKKEKSYIDD